MGIPLGVTALPTEFDFIPDFSALCAPFQQLPDGSGIAIAQVFVQPVLLMFVFSLLMSDFFDTMGTMMAVGQQGDFVDEDGNVKNTREILLVDSAGAIVGGFAGASSITSFAESTSARRPARARVCRTCGMQLAFFGVRLPGSRHRHGVQLGHVRRAGDRGLPYDERHRQDRLGQP